MASYLFVVARAMLRKCRNEEKRIGRVLYVRNSTLEPGLAPEQHCSIHYHLSDHGILPRRLVATICYDSSCVLLQAIG